MPPSTARRRIFRIVQWAFVVVVLVFAGWALHDQWRAVQTALRQAHPRWSLLLLSGLIVFAAYAALVEAWRLVLRGWHYNLPIFDAVYIWFVSNLGKYVPGKVWTISVMAVMLQRRGVPPASAATASLLISLIYTLVGFLVAAATGASALSLPPVVVAAIVFLGAALLLAPHLLPRITTLAGRLLGREIAIPTPSTRTIILTAAISAVAWVLYGIAFRVFTLGLLGSAPGSLALYTAVYTGSYLIGFVAIFAPGGIGVRETVMTSALTGAGMAIGPALLVGVASRLWITVLEILPAALLLLIRPLRREKADAPPEVASDAR
ncbi:MAG TPA: lysylphosphatidylglycerol synthase transmembrane domain-containing protein [Gemmatimonadaceae bacterium]|nr:lysylphosphatidylglycerol synthase transmembrane domain-containing protein [Gemmatimonadaceae bacterium]